MEDGSIDKRTILKTDLKEIGWEDMNCHVAYSGRAHTGLMWLWTGTGTGDGLPLTVQ